MRRGVDLRIGDNDNALPFDTVVLDLRLPDMDDLSLLRRFASSFRGGRLILMTAFGTPEIVADAQALGASVLNKPFELDELRQLVLGSASGLMPNATVLVVDDEPLIRWSLVNRLKEEGYRTVEAGTADDAVALHRDGVDLVLLDFALPDANGLAVLKQIKDTDPDTLVIMLTANTEVGVAVEAMKSGAFHYANKPFDPEALLSTGVLAGAPQLTSVARDARERMTRVAASLAKRWICASTNSGIGRRRP